MDGVVAVTVDEGATDGPWTLPRGWQTVELRDIVDRLTDGTHQPPKFTSSGVPFVLISNVSREGIDWSSIKKWVSPTTYTAECMRLQPLPDDILYTAVGSYGLALRVLDDREFMFQRHVAFLRPNKSLVDPTYLCFALNSPLIKLQADRVARGVAQKTVTLGSLREFDIPLAPLTEQRRIVARLDELFAEIGEGEAALAEARKGLDTFRRALLKAAVTGELTKDWRAANPVAEAGHDLLARIANERAGNTTPNGRARRAAGAAPIDTSSLPDLPDGWIWSTVRQLADVMGGLTKNPDREKLNDRAPYLRVANVQTGSLDLSEIKEIGVTNDDRQRAALEVNDLLIVEGNGSIDQIGRCAIWTGEIAGCVHQNHIIKVRFGEPQLPHWGFTWLLSPHGREQIERVAASTSGLHTLSISKVEALPVPIPPIAEAAEILRRVSEALTASTDTLAMLDAEAADAARLKQSILKAAFEGRLVPQDPADEPAAAMLARLRASRPEPQPRRRARNRAAP